MKFYVMFIDQKKFLFSIHTSAINDSGALERSIHDKDTKSILITPVPRLAIFNLG